MCRDVLTTGFHVRHLALAVEIVDEEQQKVHAEILPRTDDVGVSAMISLYCTHKYNQTLRGAAYYGELIMTRIATSARVPALRVRHCEDWLFNRIEALTNEQLRHLKADNCDDCRKVRREVMWRWAKLNHHLTWHTI